MTLETIRYEKKPGTSTVWIEVSRTVEETDEETRIRVFDASPFFRRLGGSEYSERISTGGRFYRNVSTSPDRMNRTERIFHF